MSNTLLWLVIGLAAGGAVAAQGPVNAELAKHVGSAVNASFTSFLVGTLSLSLVLIMMRSTIPAPSSMAEAPWWAWSGGLYGAFLVTLSVVAIPRVGVAPWIGALIAGQLIMSLVYDHFGAFNQLVRSVTWERAAGVALLLLGAWLIQDR
ncbi:MAG: DMT family transporter [Pseudomonadota bacterium]